MSSYRKTRIKAVNNALTKIERMLEIVDFFAEDIQKDRSTIADLFPYFRINYEKLIGMNLDASIKLSKYFKQKFKCTCSL